MTPGGSTTEFQWNVKVIEPDDTLYELTPAISRSLKE
jgi:hypothetical protein